MRFLTFALTIFLLLPVTGQASEISDAVDKFFLMNHDILAVAEDMSLYLGWLPKEKAKMKKAAIKAVKELEEIKAYVLGLTLPAELEELRKGDTFLIDKLADIYKDVEKKESAAVEQEFAGFTAAYAKFQEDLAAIFKNYAQDRYKGIEKLSPTDLKAGNEEAKIIIDETDKKAYLGGMRLIEEGKYKDASLVFSKLSGKYKEGEVSDCLKLRMSDCLLYLDKTKETSESDEKKGLEFLSGIIEAKRYSPVIFEAFYKWRTVNQAFWRGMSNLSEIPNKEYNFKRWQVTDTIKNYLKDHPDDAWARAQIDFLLSLPNIMRGASTGNDNMIHFSRLYSRASQPATAGTQ